MQVYKTYFKILKDKRKSVLIYAIICIALTYALTMNAKPGDNQFETVKVKTMIINEDGQSALTDGFMKYLKQYVTVVDTKNSEEARKDALFFGEVEYVLTIPKGFSDSFLTNATVKLEKESAPDSIAAISLDNVIDHYFSMAKVYKSYLPKLDSDQLNTYILSSLTDKTQALVNAQASDKVVFSNAMNRVYFNFMGYAIIGTFISTISLIMLSFNQPDIRRRLNASPISNSSVNMQLILANLVFAIGFLAVVILVGFQLNKYCTVNANMLLTWLNALVFSITVLCASYMLGTMIDNRNAISAIATVASLGLSFISGVFVSQNYLGSVVLKAASVSPVYWYVRANNQIEKITSLQWSQVSETFICMAVEIGFMIAFISIALVVSKRKRQQAY